MTSASAMLASPQTGIPRTARGSCCNFRDQDRLAGGVDNIEKQAFVAEAGALDAVTAHAVARHTIGPCVLPEGSRCGVDKPQRT